MVPVYNGAAYLRECLDSLVAQTWPAREIIVMDDASTDATADIAAEYGDAVTYVRQPTNRGQFRNVEDGIARASGEFVAVYHADDIYDADIVEREAAFLLANPDAGVVFSLIRLVDATGHEYGLLTLPRSLQGRTLVDYRDVLNGVLSYKNVFLPTPAAMVRARLYDQVGGFRTEFGSAADLDMWLRLARITRIGFLEQHLMRYRHTAGSVGQSYQLARTTPENFFTVMDCELAESGNAAVEPASRRAYNAHRAVDALRLSVNAYINQDTQAARQAWRSAHVTDLLRSNRIKRPRHVALWIAMGLLGHLPHSRQAAHALHWRYYGRLPWWKA